jgi:stage V sporulation protein SpoVS
MSDSIRGYRVLTPEETDLVNSIKEQGDLMGQALDATATAQGIDQRALAIARTHLQTGLMWWVRAITRPEGL